MCGVGEAVRFACRPRCRLIVLFVPMTSIGNREDNQAAHSLNRKSGTLHYVFSWQDGTPAKPPILPRKAIEQSVLVRCRLSRPLCSLLAECPSTTASIAAAPPSWASKLSTFLPIYVNITFYKTSAPAASARWLIRNQWFRPSGPNPQSALVLAPVGPPPLLHPPRGHPARR